MDHNVKPRIRDRGPDDQAFRLGELSQKKSAYCTLSDLISWANWKQWTEREPCPYVDFVFNASGADRIFF